MSWFEEKCVFCAHYDRRKGRCAVMGEKVRLIEGSCAGFIADAPIKREKP